jgi:flavin-dependent dehydrogenase
VERSVFDKRLFDNALAHGVVGYQQEQVKRVQCTADEVQVKTDKGLYQGRYFIDATGRNALMGKTFNSINKINNLGKFAQTSRITTTSKALTVAPTVSVTKISFYAHFR